MSSSNRVRIAFIEEVTLGVTPGAGNFSTARFTSEGLSGSPGTTESQQIRADRLASGQVITSLEVGGELSFELAKESALELFIASAMLSSWSTVAAVTAMTLEIDATARTVERSAGDWNSHVAVGDVSTLGGFTNAVNNTKIQVIEIVSNTVIRVAFDETNGPVVDEVGDGDETYSRADKISIGTTKKSFSMEKSFLDLTNKAIIYKGMMVNTMSLSIAYGSIVTGSFEFNGTSYSTADLAAEFITDGRTINAPATTESFNGSVDMPILISSLIDPDGEEIDFCIQSLGIDLNNNMQAQTCIGEVAPKDYSPGTAQIEVSLSTYLADGNWDSLVKKLQQTPFSIGAVVKNGDGFYGFYMPAVQVSFDDPASAGANQEVSLDMTGVAKVGDNGESSLYIYRG